MNLDATDLQQLSTDELEQYVVDPALGVVLEEVQLYTYFHLIIKVYIIIL